MKIEVKHSDESEKYIEETFSRYKEVDSLPKIINGKTIIHMYPYEDTIQGNGELIGFRDSYICKLHIYDVDNLTVYKTCCKDEVDLQIPCRVRIFKDLSTVIIINRPVSFINAQSFIVVDYKKE